MIAPARRLAFEALQRIDSAEAFSDAALNSPKLQSLEIRDRNLVTEIVYGCLRRLILLDQVLSEASFISWENVEPAIKNILRMSLYQLWHMDRVPDHAVVNDAVELSKRAASSRGAPGFVNGVLRSLVRRRPWGEIGFALGFPEWVRVSLPQWLWLRWVSRYGKEIAAAYAESLCETPRCTFWSNDSKAGEIRDSIPSEIVPGTRLSASPVTGKSVWVQDEASQLIAHLIGSNKVARIWDACACPGGKAALLSSNTGPEGLVIASDRSKIRVQRMARAFHQFFGAPRPVLVADALRLPPFRIEFDVVLADVPCSGLGTLRRNPEIKWRVKPGQFEAIRSKQVCILSSVAAAVRRGGLLLYSTCSTEPEENEMVVDRFLEAHPEFRPIRPRNPPGVERWLDSRGFLRTYPDTRRWDGFFAALMIRNS